MAAVALSVTSLDPKVHKRSSREPRPAQAGRGDQGAERSRRPEPFAIAPVIPQITDHELEAIVEAAAEGGRLRSHFYLPVRLPHEVAPLFRAWLDEHFPDRASKVMATIQSLRGGRDNDPNFFTGCAGQGPWADLIRTRFEIACRKHNGLASKIPLRRDLFEPPQGNQLRLL